MAGWDRLRQLVRLEIVQRREEGCSVDGMEEKWRACGEDEAKLTELYRELARLEVSTDFPFEEPSDLTGIRRLRPDGPRRYEADHDEMTWNDRFLGAWLGRLSGCALGKPLENWAMMSGSDGRPGWRNVQLWFEGADAYPIRGYVPERSRAESLGLSLARWGSASTRESIRFMESDDDVRYTVLGLLMLEERGLNWDSWDIGKLWHSRLAYQQVCTAETQAYLNFAQTTFHAGGEKPADWEARLAWVRTHLNPYREWIGAQIRADGFAYGAAGHPELAAELAWRDASFSHVKNGIYGEMFVAAMIAAAFVESDPEKIVAAGLSEIPATSRLAADVQRAIEIARSAEEPLELVERIWEAFKHYDPVHTNNNAALVAASLIHANGDFDKGITTAVLGGWDTDCNGATVGSILGASLGARVLPAQWIEPLNDTLHADLHGFHPIAISECARRSYRVFRRLREEAASLAD
ncbi:ADP-ribosylglycohydrolase family protein [Cohnella zeiphila]|uniref:ADP-ribosylglycohydrolase family protein n=1 Tax=Cohnella zeiphila TaxID=2761120 RepID=A0A7X0VWM8_9BACL|nr:ADP-ribosylglycohydrolase family protein [Cohnella zeiphila]MBB6732562.1 ADP-ribosylglycohydrolase family protein [Cohnella zeiphila]